MTSDTTADATADTTDGPAEPLAQPGDIIRAKWTMDGATTLAEAADRLEGLVGWLRELHDAGWTLDGPVNDDYGFLVDPSGDRGPHFDDE